jgi:hypothetical protein
MPCVLQAYARRMRASKWAKADATAELPPVPELCFDDLLTSEERELVAQQLGQGQQAQREAFDGQGQAGS